MFAILIMLAYLTDPTLTVSTSGRQAPGYFMVSAVNHDSAGFIDNSGYFVHPIYTGPNINQAPTPYRGYTYFDGVKGVFVHVDNTLRIRDTFAVTSPYITDFHEGYYTRRRRFILLGREERVLDLSQYVQGASESATVLGAVIQEFDRWGRKTFEWKSLDHIPTTEATIDIDLTHNRIDYIHANAIVEDGEGNFLLSCRNLDQIIKIDRATGIVVWRLGGASASRNDFTFVNDTVNGYVGFSHQHAPILTRAGEIMLFDNGNLKPDRNTRVVAYRINETLLTATKTWEYYPEAPDMFAATMGSVQELSNGNILIGWGTTQYPVIATEVDRLGNTHASLESTTQLEFPYRVYKSTAGMTAIRKTITGEEPVVFDDIDSTTRFTVLSPTPTETTTVTIEHHSYPPHNQETTDTPPCYVVPERWVVAVADTSTILAARIDLSRTPAEQNPEEVVVYHRPQEGQGPFTQQQASAISASSSVSLRRLLPGEYLIGTKLCNQPTLIYPPNYGDYESAAIPLQWTGAMGADGYEVEVATDQEFSRDVLFMRTSRPDTTIKGLQPNTTYYWHVRVIRQPEVGNWTQTWTFNTMTTSSITQSDDDAEIPVGSTVVVYDVLGNVVAREHIQLERQQLAPYISDKLLIVLATTPTGATLRRIIYR